MPRGRQKPEVKKEREEYAISLFQKNPSLSAAKANAEVKAKFGSMIRNKRVYEIRSLVQAQQKGLGTAQGQVVAGRRGKKAPKVLGRNPGEGDSEIKKAVAGIGLVEGTPDQIRFFTQTWNELQTQGLVKSPVDHSSDTYAVVRG